MVIRKTDRTGTMAAAALVALLLPVVQGARAPGPDSVVDLAVESGTISVIGTSNAHDWRCETSRFGAELQVRTGGVAVVPAAVTRAVVEVPAEALACGNGGMEKNLRKALKAGEYPTIVFTMTGHELVPDTADPGAFRVSATGTLSVAGVTRPITMAVDGSAEDGRLRIRGSHELLMTDFGVKPPTAMLGVLKTGDGVTVEFDLTMRYDPPVR